MAQHPTEPAAEQTQPEALASAMALLSGRAVGSLSFNRRRALQGLVMGTVGLALPPLTMLASHSPRRVGAMDDLPSGSTRGCVSACSPREPAHEVGAPL